MTVSQICSDAVKLIGIKVTFYLLKMFNTANNRIGWTVGHAHFS